MKISELIKKLREGNAKDEVVIDFGKGYTTDIDVSYDDNGVAYIYVVVGAEEY